VSESRDLTEVARLLTGNVSLSTEIVRRQAAIAALHRHARHRRAWPRRPRRVRLPSDRSIRVGPIWRGSEI
jgi:hypothetical protein